MTDRLKMLEQMLVDDPTDSFVWYAIAKEWEKTDPQKAVETYLKLKEINPSYVGLYYHLGKLYEELEETDLARTAYDEGINVAKKQADFHSLSELSSARTNLDI